jgi:histidine triad (HIT) family protein
MTDDPTDNTPLRHDSAPPSLFMRILRKEIPSFEVYEDAHVYGFLTQDAIRHGHALLIPKVEVDYFVDVPEPYYSAVFQAAKPVSRAIQQVTGCVRVGTIIAGWDVPHFHYHLVPMFEYEDLDLARARPYSDTENQTMAEAIRNALASGT